mgnify:CR=1 FL=1
MFIYFQEIDCETKEIISDSYFADIPLPKLEGSEEFICNKPNAGKNNTNHILVSGSSSEVKKDANILVFTFYLGNKKINIHISLINYEKIINSSRNKDKLKNAASTEKTVEAIFNTIREYIDASDATEALLDFVE